MTLSKTETREMLALMCRNKPVTVLDYVPPAPRFNTHTGYQVPTADMFDAGYLAEIQGDQAMIPVYDEDGFWTADAPLARKKGQEWRDEVELQESGEIVGYWGEGQ